jgi:hypothetical protein
MTVASTILIYGPVQKVEGIVAEFVEAGKTAGGDLTSHWEHPSRSHLPARTMRIEGRFADEASMKAYHKAVAKEVMAQESARPEIHEAERWTLIKYQTWSVLMEYPAGCG